MYVFTEIVGCGEIGKRAIETFHEFHPDIPLTIWGTNKDFEWIDPHPSQILMEASSSIIDGYRTGGHLGTARLWSQIIVNNPASKIIHFDSDVVFRGNLIDRIAEALNSFHLVGPRRNYKNNPNNRDDCRDRPDVVQTLCFGFNAALIPNKERESLVRRCLCQETQLPVIDFFDPISFQILEAGGKPLFLDPDLVGGCMPDGTRNNKHPLMNSKIDYGDLLMHFAGVGSGCNLVGMGKTPSTPYEEFAVKRYHLYRKMIYGTE